MKNYGEMILSHYEKFFGEYENTMMYEFSSLNCAIRVFQYDNVFEGLKTFVTYGFSKYQSPKREIFFNIDKDAENAQNILINALVFLIENNLKIERGKFIKNIDGLNPEFCSLHNKSAIYFTNPFGCPDGFMNIEDEIEIYLAFFISLKELSVLEEKGFEEFEDYLEENEIDVFELDRTDK